MAHSTFIVTLFPSGKYSIGVSGDDPIAVKAGIVWARGVAEGLDRPAEAQPAPEETPEAEEAPLCAVHQQPMRRQLGKYGGFWSCHQKNADGSYCSYRPAKEKQ